jgi:hypothetical protein
MRTRPRISYGSDRAFRDSRRWLGGVNREPVALWRVRSVSEDPNLTRRHAYVYMTAGNRILPPALIRQLEALNVSILRKPFDIEDLIALIDDASRRLEARGSPPGR